MPLFFGKEKVNVSGQPLSTIELKYSGSPSTSSVLSILDYVTVGDGVIIENGIASNFRSSPISCLKIPAGTYPFNSGSIFRLTFTTGEVINEQSYIEQILYYPSREFYIQNNKFGSYGNGAKLTTVAEPNTKYIVDLPWTQTGILTIYDENMNVLETTELVTGDDSFMQEMELGCRYRATGREFYGTIDLNNTGILL